MSTIAKSPPSKSGFRPFPLLDYKQINTIILSFTVAALFCLWGEARGQDTNWLELLKVAQKSTQGRFPQGEAKVVLREGQTGKVNVHNYYDCHVIWSGAKVWTSIDKWRVESRNSFPLEPCFDREVWIVDGLKSILFAPLNGSVVTSSIVDGGPPLRSRLSPDFSWFGPWGGEGSPWITLLDPRLITRVDNTKITYKTKSLSSDLIEVRREDGHLKSSMVMVFSLEKDGNLVRSDLKMPSNKYEIHETCEWKKDSSGAWFLSKRIEDMVQHLHDDFATLYKEYETISFDASHLPKPSRFKLESLKLPGGTTITDTSGKMIQRVGDPPVQTVVGELDRLSDRMRSQGFAAGR